MPKTILFVILDQYTDWEAAYVSCFINAFGGSLYPSSSGTYTIKTVSLKKEGMLSCGGFTALPDYSLDSLPEDFAGLVLVGGMSWRKEEALRVKPLVERALAEGKVLGAICDAVGFLGLIGVLNEVKHTGNDLEGIKQWAGSAYGGEANYLLQQAVRDKNIVTANGTAALEFAKELCLALGLASEEQIEEWFQFYKKGPYLAPMPKI